MVGEIVVTRMHPSNRNKGLSYLRGRTLKHRGEIYLWVHIKNELRQAPYGGLNRDSQRQTVK